MYPRRKGGVLDKDRGPGVESRETPMLSSFSFVGDCRGRRPSQAVAGHGRRRRRRGPRSQEEEGKRSHAMASHGKPLASHASQRRRHHQWQAMASHGKPNGKPWQAWQAVASHGKRSQAWQATASQAGDAGDQAVARRSQAAIRRSPGGRENSLKNPLVRWLFVFFLRERRFLPASIPPAHHQWSSSSDASDHPPAATASVASYQDLCDSCCV